MGASQFGKIGAAIACMILAVVLFLQAAGGVTQRQNPALAAQLWPLDGLALEQAAAREFMGAVQKPADILPAAQAASATAQRAFALDPLNPKSFAILAMATTDPEDKRAILERATAINRRNLLLQGLVLEGQVERKEYAETFETLDTILRVHPEQRENFFPILEQALEDEAALPAMASILDQSSDWQEDFLRTATRNKDSLPNLAALRLTRDSVPPEVDRRLVSGLAESGRPDLADQVYRAATNNDDANERITRLDWSSRFAPFDWALADEAGFRAQMARNSTELEVQVRGGEGGVLARRLISTPGGAFAIRVSHSLGPPRQVSDVRLKLTCPDAEEPFFDQPFRVGERRFDVNAAPAACDYFEIAVHARAWTGRSAIRGTIDPLEIIRR